MLPTPSTIQPTINPPLKRPSLGRPRGRPPGPKVPGSSRPRGRPSLNMNTNYWQNQMLKTNAVYDYMKHYQDELIRQYSKTLTLNQLAQLGQYFNQTSLANQYNLPSTSQSTLLNQAHMINALHSATASQFADGLKKKSAVDALSSSLASSSQLAAYNMQQSLKQFGGMGSAEKISSKTATSVDPRLSQASTSSLNYIPASTSKLSTPLSTQNTKSAFTMPVLTTASSSSAAHKYTNADFSKQKTKTTYSYQQAYLVMII